MTTAINRYRPDYAVPPGWVLAERLQAQGFSAADLARQCGRSRKLISQIIAGKAPVEPGTALQFERVLGVDARIWLGIEAEYRLHHARKREAGDAAARAWSKKFPLRELVRRGVISRPESDADACSLLLSFFRVGSVAAWGIKYDPANVAYRHSPSIRSDGPALATWLRLGEIDAAGQECVAHNKSAFRRALKEIRGLTRAPIDEALSHARELCNQSGVALALVAPIQGAAVSGAAWWPSPGKAVIGLSARHKSDDHLWFSFFHEAAHILLHSKKGVFVDANNRDGDECEAEANQWAANMLVPRSAWRKFAESFQGGKQEVLSFAEAQGVAPGILVGRLQHEGIIPWSVLNDLKVRLTWR